MLKLFTMPVSNLLKKLNCRNTRIFPSINTITKIIFVILIAFTITFLTKNILAQNIIKQTQDAQIQSNNAESWQLNSWNTNAVNVLTTLTGAIPFKEDGSVDTEKFQVQGLLGTSNKMISSLYNPQASGVEYIAQVKDNFLGKPTYAQGVAFRENKSLQPLLPIWRALRNVVYLLSSIIFIAIGIMIMLRVKISPQAVITIQNSIPKLITSLILVTFSYAIAGLIIDLSYWIQGLVVALLFTAKGVNFGNNLYDQVAWQTLFPLDMIPIQPHWYSFNGLVNADFVKISMLANRTVPHFSLIQLGGVIGQVVLGSIIGGATGLLGSALSGGGNIVGDAIGWVIGAVGGVIFMIILFILVAIWLIKLFFGLLTTYVTIIIQIVTAPFIIGMGAFPNSKVNFSSWLTDLISKVAVFPVVLIVLVFINYLIEICGSNLWIPSLLNTDTSGGYGNIIGAAIGLAGLAMLSKLPTLVPEAIFSLKPSPFGKAIGENMGKNPITGAGSLIGRGVQHGITEDIGTRATKGQTVTGIKNKINDWRFERAQNQWTKKQEKTANKSNYKSGPPSKS